MISFENKEALKEKILTSKGFEINNYNESPPTFKKTTN